MANATITGNNSGNSATLTNATDGSGTPSQDESDVTVQTSNATVSGFGSFYDVTFLGGSDTLLAQNMPWANPDFGDDSVAFDSIDMGSGDDSVDLDRSAFRNLDMGSGDDTLRMVNSGGQTANLGADNDFLQADLSTANAASEEELAQKDAQPLLDMDGGTGDDTLNLVGDWTVTLTSGNVTIDPGNDGFDTTVTNVFTSNDYKDITGYPGLLNGSVQWADPQTLSGGEEVHMAFEFSNFEAIEAVCFAAGTLIATPTAQIDVAKLRVGDLVLTRKGPMPIRWIGKRRLDVIDLMANPKLLPIRIPAGALGGGVPRRPLCVSPQHRLVLSSDIAEQMFAEREVLVAAKHLVGWNGIDVDGETREIQYFHILLDEHAIVEAEGALAETLLPGPQALEMLPRTALEELLAIFPDLYARAELRDKHAALPLLKGRDCRALVSRIREDAC